MADEPGLGLATLLAPVFYGSPMTVRVISGIFITLGIAFLTPVVSLVAFDIALWLWRLYSIGRGAYLRRQRLLRDEQRELRRQQQQEKMQQQEKKSKPTREAQTGVTSSTTSTSTSITTSTSQGTRRR